MTRMTSKGQVTIPTHIRDKLGVSAGDEIGFREDGQVGERLVRELMEFGDRMRNEGKVDPFYAKMTTDEIMEELRGYSEDKDDPGFQRRP